MSVSNWGLFNCRGIIHALGGDIEIDSIEGEGTLVRITLPTSRGIGQEARSVKERNESRPD